MIQNSYGIGCDHSNTLCNLLQPCGANGTCINNNTHPHGYICKYSVNHICKSNPCLHGGTLFIHFYTKVKRKSFLIYLGNCSATNGRNFNCTCPFGWYGKHCEIIDDHCQSFPCQNNAVCQPLPGSYECKCLHDSYSGRNCEIVGIKIKTLRFVSKSFATVAIAILVCTGSFIVIMDILKYGFAIDPVEPERRRLRQQRLAKRRKPIIQRFVYVNAPAV